MHCYHAVAVPSVGMGNGKTGMGRERNGMWTSLTSGLNLVYALPEDGGDLHAFQLHQSSQIYTVYCVYVCVCVCVCDIVYSMKVSFIINKSPTIANVQH